MLESLVKKLAVKRAELKEVENKKKEENSELITLAKREENLKELI